MTRIVFAYDGSAAATAAIAWMRGATAGADAAPMDRGHAKGAAPDDAASPHAAPRGGTSRGEAPLAGAARDWAAEDETAVGGAPVAGASMERAQPDGGRVEIVTLTLDLGQRDELDAARERALAAGAVRAHVLDVRESFAQDYLLPALRADAACDEGRPMGRALSRPLIARQLVDVARMEGATVVAHGGAGWRDAEDRARLTHAIRLIAPAIDVRTPLAEWQPTEEEMQAFAEARGLRLPRIASRVMADLWGRCARLDATPLAAAATVSDPRAADTASAGAPHRQAAHASVARHDAGRTGATDAFVYTQTKSPEEALATPAFVDVAFERGAPVGISGVGMPLLEIISSLEAIAGAHGVGRAEALDASEAGSFGPPAAVGSATPVRAPAASATSPSAAQASAASGPVAPSASVASAAAPTASPARVLARIVCESPAATVLDVAHRALERAVLSQDVLAPLAQVRVWYRDAVRRGAWAGLPRESAQAFIDRVQAGVTGTVTVELSRGRCRVLAIQPG